jgi:hypothetical protein
VCAAGLRIAKVSGSTISYYHEDALGSSRLVTDASRKLLFSDSYQPFGQDQSTGIETYRFTGKPVSQTTDLCNNWPVVVQSDCGAVHFAGTRPVPHLSTPQFFNLYSWITDGPTCSGIPV